MQPPCSLGTPHPTSHCPADNTHGLSVGLGKAVAKAQVGLHVSPSHCSDIVSAVLKHEGEQGERSQGLGMLKPVAWAWGSALSPCRL